MAEEPLAREEISLASSLQPGSRGTTATLKRAMDISGVLRAVQLVDQALLKADRWAVLDKGVAAVVATFEASTAREQD